MANAQPKEWRRCFYCQKHEEELGSKMLCCKRCRESGSRTYYCNSHCQKAHWNLHKLLCGAPVKRDEEGGDGTALQRWVAIYRNTIAWVYAQAFIHWPPTPGHNFLLIEMVRKPNIGQIPVFHLWNCSYHTAEELDRLLEIKMPEGLGNALLIRTVAGMWVQTFHITGKVESHPVKTWMQILKELAAMALTTNDDKAFGVSVRRREIFDLIVGPGNDETCMPDIPEMTFDNPTLDDRIFECFINPRFHEWYKKHSDIELLARWKTIELEQPVPIVIYQIWVKDAFIRAKWQTDQERKDMEKFLEDTGVQISSKP